MRASPAESIPRDGELDGTLALLREGYRYISNRCERNGSDAFETRLMLRPVVCARGADAARMFYEPGRFTRRGALPPTALLLLQDLGSVQVKDGAAHRHRKGMFMAAMAPAEVRRLADLTAAHWRAALPRWEEAGEVELHGAAREVLCRAVCEWAAVPLPEREVRWRTRELGAMIDGAGSVGPRNWWGLLLRERTEAWLRDVVEGARAGRLPVPEGSPAHRVAWHREQDGELLPVPVAAVELLNLLRPTVAVARFVTFAALALHEHPESLPPIRAEQPDYLEWFVQEVRRYYPFFPAIGGRARESFRWRGRRFEPGSWVLLDLYGTNHDPAVWADPNTFRPERFREWDGSAFNFIPQGAGDHRAGHRCPGESATIEIMKETVRLLAAEMRYQVPPQDLRIDLSRMPAIPASGFVIRDVRRA